MKNNAFTLAELMICLVIIGVLGALTIPALNARPNSNMLLLRKAYKATTEVVADLLTIDAYYPNGLLQEDRDIEDEDTQNLIADNNNDIQVNYNNQTQRFCSLFVNYMNTTGNIDCKHTKTLNDGGNFTTTDGIVWSIPIDNFSVAGNKTISIDINGLDDKNGKPNCLYDADTCKDPDRFNILIDRTGRITVDDDKTKEYLGKNTNITKK